MIYPVDTSCWYVIGLCTLILISQKFAVQQKHVLSQTTAAASAASAAAAAAAYSRPGSTNHGVFLITLCFADSIKEPYDSPAQHHGNNLQTARTQTHAAHVCHHLFGIHWMQNTNGMQSCYFTLHLMLQCQDGISAKRNCRHYLQPVQLLTLEKKMHVHDGHAGTQQFQSTWWQSSAEPSPVHHAEDFLHALVLPASAHAH